jgi:hypothetical protein
MEQGFVGQAVLVLEGFAWLNQVNRFDVGAIEFEAFTSSGREDHPRGRFSLQSQPA